MLRIFKGTGPGVILLVVVTLCALWISAFLHPQMAGSSVFESSPMPLYGIVKLLVGNNPLPGVLFSSLIMIFMLFLMVYFNTKVFFINERTFLPALFYLFFSALFPQCQVLNPVLPAVVFLMLAIIRIMDSYRKPGVAFNFFDAGVLISIGSLFYANLIWFGLLLIIGIALLRTGSIKEIAISILGLVTPYILVTGLYYVFGKDLLNFFSDIKENLFGNAESQLISRLTVIVLICIGLTLIISIVFLLMQMNTKKIKTRKTFSLLLWGFFISLILYFTLPSVSVEMIWITGIPASYFLTHYFVFARKRVLPEILFSVLFLLILLVQAFYIF
jgi:hypothetical protein